MPSRRRSRSQSRKSSNVIGVAVLQDSGIMGDRKITGEVLFQESGKKRGKTVKMSGVVRGLFPHGIHAIHLHEAGDLRAKGCAGACSHFNPHGRNHGGITGIERHVGDFGNLRADSHGVAKFDSMIVPGVKLKGKNSIMGRSVVIHLKEDDLGKGGTNESRKTGSAGPRIACGVVGYAQNSDLYF